MLGAYRKFVGGGINTLDEDITSYGETGKVGVNVRESGEDLAIVLEHMLLANFEGDVGRHEACNRQFRKLEKKSINY